MAPVARRRVGLLAGLCYLDCAALHAHALVDHRRIAGEEHGFAVAPVVRLVSASETRTTYVQLARPLASFAARCHRPIGTLGLSLNHMER